MQVVKYTKLVLAGYNFKVNIILAALQKKPFDIWYKRIKRISI